MPRSRCAPAPRLLGPSARAGQRASTQTGGGLASAPGQPHEATAAVRIWPPPAVPRIGGRACAAPPPAPQGLLDSILGAAPGTNGSAAASFKPDYNAVRRRGPQLLGCRGAPARGGAACTACPSSLLPAACFHASQLAPPCACRCAGAQGD